jgi:hypothetical protein
LLFIAVAQCATLDATHEDNKGELVRSWFNALDASTSHSVDHFRKLFDEHATYVYNQGNYTPDDVIRDVVNVQKSFAMWFPKGGDAKASVHVFFETSDRAMSFVSGTYCFTLPSREKASYRWAGLAHWAGNRIVKYSKFGDFTHCLNSIKAGKMLKEESDLWE